MTGHLKMAKLDFFTMKSQLATYLSLAAIVLLFGFMGSSVTVLCVTGAWFVALMSSNIFSIQEKNNLNRLYGSVSVKLKDVVLGRYIFTFLNYIISFFVIIVIYAAFALFQNKSLEVSDFILGFSLSLLVYSLITGIQMPMFFKMGYTKAKVWSLIPFIGVMAVVVIPSFVSGLSSIMQFLTSNRSVLIVCGILASCIIQYVSYRVSIIAYRKRT